ncbi:MAG: hypothetical protein JWM78_2749 [Verrucomicrobiaceae bacterium]|nr:hypothetical protein [Verrucomicrobiaceae bacterium]
MRVGVEYITLLGIGPLEMIACAAAAECRDISLVLSRPDFNPYDYPFFSLIDDARLRRETVASLRDNNVSIALVDGFAVFPGSDAAQQRPAFDVLAELGVKRINAISFDPARARSLDQIGEIVTMAGSYGITATMEPCPMLTFKTLAEVLEVIEAVALPNFKLLIDTMHLTRVGDTAADLARLDPQLIDYVQLSDGPSVIADPFNYMDEAMNERMIPGDGDMPLVDILRAVRADLVVSVEVPMRSLAQAGVSAQERVQRAVAGARRVIASAAQT